MLLTPGEELFCLREPPLTDSQQRERRDGRRRHGGIAAAVRVECSLERGLGIVPSALRDEHVGMDGPAGADQDRQPVPVRERVDRLASAARSHSPAAVDAMIRLQ